VKGVKVIGIDDWAWRKGQNYGTILVDPNTAYQSSAGMTSTCTRVDKCKVSS